MRFSTGLVSIKNATNNSGASKFACVDYIHISETFDIVTSCLAHAYWPVSQSVLARSRIFNTLAFVQRQLRYLLHLLHNERLKLNQNAFPNPVAHLRVERSTIIKESERWSVPAGRVNDSTNPKIVKIDSTYSDTATGFTFCACELNSILCRQCERLFLSCVWA